MLDKNYKLRYNNPSNLYYDFSEDLNMFEKLKEVLVEELQIDADDITMDAELSKDLNINSIELADLIMVCEEKFGVEIADDDSNKFVTVGDVVEYLESL